MSKYVFEAKRVVTMHGVHLPAASAIKARAKYGRLLKCGGSVKTWKSRFFVLDGHRAVLNYYVKHTDKRAIGFIPLWDAELGRDPDRSFCMTINNPVRRVYQVQAKSSEDFKEWMTACKKVQAQCLGGLFKSSLAFWKQAFGERSSVPWPWFWEKFYKAVPKRLSEEDETRFRYVMASLDKSNPAEITVQQLKAFVFQFGDIHTAYTKMGAVMKFYNGQISFVDAERLLKGQKPGTFLLRQIRYGEFFGVLVVSYVNAKKKLKHKPIFREPFLRVYYHEPGLPALPSLGQVVANAIKLRTLMGRNSAAKKELMAQLLAMSRDERAQGLQPLPECSQTATATAAADSGSMSMTRVSEDSSGISQQMDALLGSLEAAAHSKMMSPDKSESAASPSMFEDEAEVFDQHEEEEEEEEEDYPQDVLSSTQVLNAELDDIFDPPEAGSTSFPSGDNNFCASCGTARMNAFLPTCEECGSAFDGGGIEEGEEEEEYPLQSPSGLGRGKAIAPSAAPPSSGGRGRGVVRQSVLVELEEDYGIREEDLGDLSALVLEDTLEFADADEDMANKAEPTPKITQVLPRMTAADRKAAVDKDAELQALLATDFNFCPANQPPTNPN